MAHALLRAVLTLVLTLGSKDRVLKACLGLMISAYLPHLSGSRLQMPGHIYQNDSLVSFQQ